MLPPPSLSSLVRLRPVPPPQALASPACRARRSSALSPSAARAQPPRSAPRPCAQLHAQATRHHRGALHHGAHALCAASVRRRPCALSPCLHSRSVATILTSTSSCSRRWWARARASSPRSSTSIGQRLALRCAGPARPPGVCRRIMFSAYESSRLYRDLKLRGAIIRDKQVRELPHVWVRKLGCG